MNSSNSNKIFICATEQSGDNIGEKLIHSLRVYDEFNFDGVGGNKMSPLMNKQYYSISDFKSIGIIEVLTSLKRYIKMINELSEIILNNDYKIVITIDSPDFNYPLAKKIKQKNFKGKIIQIVAPTVWAWRKNRSKKFAKIFDQLFTIFPFEESYFIRYNLKTKYIGHPIFHIKGIPNNSKKYFVFLPGSREGEINSLIKYFKIASDYLNEICSDFDIVIPTLNHLENKLIKLTSSWRKKPIILTNSNEIENIFSQTKLALVCSGTASLEISKRKIPQLVIYKLNIISVFILYFLVKVNYVNIINIMAKKIIIPELINLNLNKNSFLYNFKKLIYESEQQNPKQIILSKPYLDQLILEQSPEEIIAKEVNNLFL